MIMSLEQRKIKIKPKKKIEPQHIYQKRMSVPFESDVLNLLLKNDAKDKMEFVSVKNHYLKTHRTDLIEPFLN